MRLAALPAHALAWIAAVAHHAAAAIWLHGGANRKRTKIRRRCGPTQDRRQHEKRALSSPSHGNLFGLSIVEHDCQSGALTVIWITGVGAGVLDPLRYAMG